MGRVGKDAEYDYYIRCVDADGAVVLPSGLANDIVYDANGTYVNIEGTFLGLRVLSVDGLSSRGAVRNVYTETYAELDGVRLYLPKRDELVRESVEIQMELCFTGEERRDVYDSFVDWVSGCRVSYWDTVRGRSIDMYLSDSSEPGTDVLYGDVPYMCVTLTFMGLSGSSSVHQD